MAGICELSFVQKLFFIVSAIAFTQQSTAQTCLEEKPKLKNTDKLVVKIFFQGGDMKNLKDDLCAVLDEFDGLVSVTYMMGATANEENGDLNCGSDGCDKDRELACQAIVLENAFHQCGPVGPPDQNLYDTCLQNKEGDTLIKESSNELEKLQIPVDKLPAIVYNDTYDPCGKYSPTDIKNYICDLYDKQMESCAK